MQFENKEDNLKNGCLGPCYDHSKGPMKVRTRLNTSEYEIELNGLACVVMLMQDDPINLSPIELLDNK